MTLSDKERGGASPGAKPRHHHRQLPSPHHKTESHSHRKAEVDGGRYTDCWRDGFVRGAVDALRTLGRRCCLDCAAEAERLTDYYQGAAGRWAS